MQPAGCGERGQQCCSASENFRACPAGSDLVCNSAGVCEPCGGAGEPCCQRLARLEPECDLRNVCTPGGCEPCGQRGERCCAGEDNAEFCQFPDALSCSRSDGDGVCVLCGGFGQPCCQIRSGDAPFCDSGSCNSSGCCGTNSCSGTISPTVTPTPPPPRPSPPPPRPSPPPPRPSPPTVSPPPVASTSPRVRTDPTGGTEFINPIAIAVDASDSLTSSQFSRLLDQVCL